MNKLFQALNAPYPYECYSSSYKGFASVTPQATSNRLNEVLGPDGWNFNVLEKEVDLNEFCVSIFGQISIRDNQNEWIVKQNFGDALMVVQEGKSEPSTQARLDAYKKATSDCMKKCASMLGVSADVYQGLIRVVSYRNQNATYTALVKKFNLEVDCSPFKEGICILPDSYKEYYQNKGWFGIFEEDYYSVKKEMMNGQVFRTKQSTQPNRVAATDEPIFKIIDVEAYVQDGKPYYKFVMEHGGIKNELYAVGQMVERVDAMSLKDGSRVTIMSETRKGKKILKLIKLVG
ncbi:Rad52/Rad22 family DNA repair protein [Paenibacillus thiaminolyticus]|uniref:Uncharacterized protein n=1 Tax=Paenibacillus thiaminolyticus TaxID=49283 RepID=A0A3A3G863_PANTH|nr:Rad52/Rad22 family DNA repair protein [Paenibacillus thiaminolyticus]RJG15200.1 hypothetical protein DQX05_29840 [Paenibacillus thiaminolyticus]